MIRVKDRVILITMKRLIPVVAALSSLIIYVVFTHAEVAAVASGQADKIFDRVFLQSIRSESTYGEIVKAVGVPGVKVGGSSIKIPGDKYHWNGRENSSFNIRMSAGKLVDANVKTPDGHILSFEGIGEVIDHGK